MEPLDLDIQDVHAGYGETAVLRGASLRITAGEIVGLVGENGAGKSTLIGVVTGRVRPSTGVVLVAGRDVSRERAAVASLIGYAPQEIGVYPSLTLRDNVEAFGRLSGLRGAALRERAAAVIHALGLDASVAVRADRLSGGQRRRLHTAMALVHRPRLVLLDEPTVGADVESRRHILELVRALADDGAAVLYTSHYLAEFEQLDARIALLRGGAVDDLGPVHHVIDRWGGGDIRLRLDPALDAPPPGEGWSKAGEWLVAPPSDRAPGPRLAEAIAQLGARASDVSEVDIRRPSFEAAYVRLLERRAPVDAAA